MKLTKKLRTIIGISTPEKIAEEIAISFKEKKENGDEETNAAVRKIMEIIKANPEPEKVTELLRIVIDAKELPDEVFKKTATEISKIEEIPDRVITEVIQKSNVPDETINGILEETQMQPKERINLMHNIEDADIIEQRIKNELNILYRVCKDKRDDEVVERVKELEELLNNGDVNTEIQNLIYQIVAKKMAENYYSDIKKGTRIFELSKIMPVEDMIDNDLPSMVQDEYQKIEENEEKKEGRFDKKGLKELILVEMGKNIAYKYDETGVFIIPQSKNMKAIDKDEEEKFIKSIQTYSRKQLSKQEVIDIDEQIRGNSNNVQIKENILINEIKKIPENNKNRNINFLIKVLENEETLQTLSMLDESGLIEKFNEIPEEKRTKTIYSIGNILDKRKRKVTESSPKIKNNQKIDIHQRTQGGR